MGQWRVTKLVQRRDDSPPARQAARGPLLLASAGDDMVVAQPGRHEDQGQVMRRLAADGQERWVCACEARPREAYVSGDRLLVLTDSLGYGPWGLLGPALLIDLGTGSLVARLRGDRGAGVGGGRFVLGLEGYDFFDTWLHDRTGATVTSWRSYGHYVPDPDGSIRVIECDRAGGGKTASRVVRLLPDGAIERGPLLAHGSVSRPVVLADGTAVFLDAGVLRAVDRELRDVVLAEVMPIGPGEAYRFHDTLTLDGDQLSVAVSERSRGDPGRYTRHSWVFRLSPERA